MKTFILINAILTTSIFVLNQAWAGGLTLPSNDPYNQSSFGVGCTDQEYSSDELAVPPTGEIQKLYLRQINQLRTLLAATLTVVPAGADGQGSSWFTKAQAFKSGLDAAALSCLQSDCFALVPHIARLLDARQGDAPEFAIKSAGFANGFSPVLIHAIERHIINQNATVSVAYLTSFTKVFCTVGFTSEGDWEATPIPVDAAGIIILDAAAVVTNLKAQPWQDADRFLGGATAADAFARYAASGNGMAVLKTKYAANQATITAKWNELTAWVAQQRPTN